MTFNKNHIDLIRTKTNY